MKAGVLSAVGWSLLLCVCELPSGSTSLSKPHGLDMPLGEALRARASTRAYDAQRGVAAGDLATILWAATGVSRPDPMNPRGGKLTAPAAYDAYAVDVLVTTSDGTFSYAPGQHALLPHPIAGKKDLRAAVPRSEWLKDAPVLVLLVANLSRYPERVTAERRRDYAHADAAVIAENIYLAAAALKLGTCLTADARPDAGELLGLGKDERIVFILPLGHPRP